MLWHSKLCSSSADSSIRSCELCGHAVWPTHARCMLHSACAAQTGTVCPTERLAKAEAVNKSLIGDNLHGDDGARGGCSHLRRDPDSDTEAAGPAGWLVRPQVVQRQHRKPAPASDAQVDGGGADLETLHKMRSGHEDGATRRTAAVVLGHRHSAAQCLESAICLRRPHMHSMPVTYPTVRRRFSVGCSSQWREVPASLMIG